MQHKNGYTEQRLKIAKQMKLNEQVRWIMETNIHNMYFFKFERAPDNLQEDVITYPEGMHEISSALTSLQTVTHS